jgi:hypothetical protein
VFLDAVKSGFTSNGWQVTEVTSAATVAAPLDACALQRAYEQVWLWLPCNNAQNMDDASFAAVTQFFDTGGGVVLLTDNHYLSPGSPNTHCDASNWKGDGGADADAYRLGQPHLLSTMAHELVLLLVHAHPLPTFRRSDLAICSTSTG